LVGDAPGGAVLLVGQFGMPMQILVESCRDLRTAKFMPIRQANAAMNATMPAPPDRWRPRYAPSAKRPAVTAT